MQVMQLLSKPEERVSLVITTNSNFRQWVGWVTAMLADRQFQGDESEAMYVADGSISGARRLRQQAFEPGAVTARLALQILSAKLPVPVSDDERPVSVIADIDAPTANVSDQSSAAGCCPWA